MYGYAFLLHLQIQTTLSVPRSLSAAMEERTELQKSKRDSISEFLAASAPKEACLLIR